MDRATCCDAWARAFKSRPPKYASVKFMQRVLVHHVQCQLLGGSSAATNRALRIALTPADAATGSKAVRHGATLIREWNGRMYRVDVASDHYSLDGKTFKSLSAVAQHITGARWSGPRFFGLTAKRSA
ncbi:DUF2924 domain-containing protein [Pseudohalocynthiibacter aestuariivivens]|nr:DUF2924 domain-containing protein [Pseudohalocynthiibacter aestuariivivens]